MKINFLVQKDVYTEYCPSCNKPSKLFNKKDVIFICPNCNAELERLIIVDPKLKWWLDDNNNYWHESVGILIIDEKRRILFYELNKFPYGLTIPAGHVDEGETPLQSVIREASEEAGIKLEGASECIKLDINGDSCRRGSDDHKWTLFVANINSEQANKIAVDGSEGKEPVWLSLSQCQSRLDDMPAAIKLIFTKYLSDIKAKIDLV
jgi:8-oxo-dGTP pyrophosphatase MutT (NUDIX family)